MLVPPTEGVGKMQRRTKAVAILVGVLIAACSNAPSAGVQAFCDTFVASEALFSGEPGPEEIEAMLGSLEELAPDEVSAVTGSITSMARQVFETGDFAIMDSDEFQEADAELKSYLSDNCGFDELDVTAVDYAFSGVDDSVEEGTRALTFTNTGTEAHELAIARINDGVTLSVDEILALPEEEASAYVSFVGGTFAMPGESGTTFVDFDSGDYFFICFVPQGATPENIPALESGELEGGAPHFTLGMVREFTVNG
jgi:hypothetical protein